MQVESTEVIKAKHEISLSPGAIKLLNEILSSGKKAEIVVVNNHLMIYEVPRSTRKYDVVIPHGE